MAGSKGRLTPGLPESCRYGISDVLSDTLVGMEAGELLFLTSGSMEIAGLGMDAPACVLADSGGGDLHLAEGIGYLVTPGGDR